MIAGTALRPAEAVAAPAVPKNFFSRRCFFMELSSAPEIMTVQEAAEYLRLKRTMAYEMVRRGIIPSIRFGRQIRVVNS